MSWPWLSFLGSFAFGFVPVHLSGGYPSEGSHESPETCQASTPANPLDGCPENTVLVSATHEQAHSRTIQGAIDSLPHDHTSQTILILSGTYTEQLNITRPGPLTLLGESNSPRNASTNSVHVQWAAATEQGIYTDNVYTSVLIVAPTLNASLTGSGPTILISGTSTPNSWPVLHMR